MASQEEAKQFLLKVPVTYQSPVEGINLQKIGMGCNVGAGLGDSV
jgi:hypothetical protein